MIVEINSVIPLSDIMILPFIGGVIAEGLAILNSLSTAWSSYDAWRSAGDVDFSGARDSVEDWFEEAGSLADRTVTESLDWIEQQYAFTTEKAESDFTRESEQALETRDLGIERGELQLSQAGETAQFQSASQAYGVKQKGDIGRQSTKGLVSGQMEESIDYGMGQVARGYDISTTQASDRFEVTEKTLESQYEHTIEDLTSAKDATINYQDMLRQHGIDTTTLSYEKSMFDLTNEYDRMMADIRTSEYSAEQYHENSVWNLFDF